MPTCPLSACPVSVKCSQCKSVSDTYDPYLDIALEIRVRPAWGAAWREARAQQGEASLTGGAGPMVSHPRTDAVSVVGLDSAFCLSLFYSNTAKIESASRGTGSD